jgi:enoyl-CoA hydratase/carnithine racemase
VHWTVTRHGVVAVITFHRPPENLLGFVLLEELDEVLLACSRDESVSVIVLTGGLAGYFVGHADLGDVDRLVHALPGPGSPDAWSTTLERLSQVDQPVVAAVNGQAWGGGAELALAAQLRVAASSAHFRFVEVAAGAIPGAGGTQRLPRLIGPSRAATMVLGGEVVTAERALAWGLVDAVLPDEDFLAHVLRWLEPIAAAPRHSLVAAKRALLDGQRMPLAEGLAYEQRLFRAVLRSPQTQARFAAEAASDPA